MPTHRRVVLGFIILAGFCARAATYRAPLLDHHAWRQADTAAISRNFYRERFNPLYPQVDQRGANLHGYVTTGLELQAFLAAGIAFATGFHHEIGRLLSAVAFIGSCLLVDAFVRRRYGERHGEVAAFLYAFGFPLLVFIERAFMNESLLILLSLGSFVAADRYLERPSPAMLAALVGATTLIALVKLPYLIVWGGIAGLFVERRGWAGLRHPALLVMALVNVAAAGAWYVHASRLGDATGLTFGFSDKLFDAAAMFSIEYPLLLAERFVKDIFGPVLAVAVLIGVWCAVRQQRWCEVFGAVAFLAYLLIVGLGNLYHDYYQLAVMPIAPSLATVGLLHAVDRVTPQHRRDTIVAVALGLALVCTFVRHVSANSWYSYSTDDVVLCETLSAASAPGERLVFVGYNDPKLLVCADRKGWLLLESDGTGLGAALAAGARVAILETSVADPVRAALQARAGAPLLTSTNFTVFRLP